MNASTDARVALVTAGNAGLGRGIAAALASAGYRTAFTYRAGGTGPDDDAGPSSFGPTYPDDCAAGCVASPSMSQSPARMAWRCSASHSMSPSRRST